MYGMEDKQRQEMWESLFTPAIRVRGRRLPFLLSLRRADAALRAAEPPVPSAFTLGAFPGRAGTGV